jgi:hypothetical protein
MVTVGAAVEITTPVRAVEVLEVTVPFVCFTVIEYVEFSKVVKVQLSVVDDAVIVQVTAVPEVGVAVKTTVAPTTSELAVKVGVLSFVFLSEFDEPVSDAVASVTVVGVATVMPVVTILRLENVAASFPKISCAAYESFADEGSA